MHELCLRPRPPPLQGKGTQDGVGGGVRGEKLQWLQRQEESPLRIHFFRLRIIIVPSTCPVPFLYNFSNKLIKSYKPLKAQLLESLPQNQVSGAS